VKTSILLLGTLAVAQGACSLNDANVDCSAELSNVVITAQAGTTQSDGSVTIYGTVEASAGDAASGEGGAELTVRAVYVAGQQVTLDADGFYYRTWSTMLTGDVVAAYAGGTSEAHIPVVAYVYGGCIARLAPAEEPVVTVPIRDGGAAQDAGTEGGDAALLGDAGDSGNSESGPRDAASEGG